MSSLEEYDSAMGNSPSFDNANESSSPDQESHHTQFLDLTNGEGGSRSGSFCAQEGDDDDDGGDDDGSAAHMSPATAAKTPAASIDPSTPGRVVDTGSEHTGRWTREEHAAFLSALKMYGKEWKKVAAKVKTRTVVQTRTHAQKYFQKLQKALSSNEGSKGGVDMGMDTKPKSLGVKRKQQQKPKGLLRGHSTASTHAAAHLMTNLSSAGSSNLPPPPPVSFVPKSTAFASYSSSQQPSYATHGFSSSTNSTNDQPLLPPSYSGGFFGQGMSIVAPEHDIALRMGKFPEPSPAATGKRKLAEMAAAQMLAGVMGGKEDTSTPPPPDVLPDTGLKKTGMSLQIVNPETLGITYEEASKRRRGPGGSSPTTPWDGELEALIRYDTCMMMLCS